MSVSLCVFTPTQYSSLSKSPFTLSPKRQASPYSTVNSVWRVLLSPVKQSCSSRDRYLSAYDNDLVTVSETAVRGTNRQINVWIWKVVKKIEGPNSEPPLQIRFKKTIM